MAWCPWTQAGAQPIISRMGSLILEIQQNAAASAVPVGDLLRQAKIAAVRLGTNEEFTTWLNRELQGYEDGKEIPKYRRVGGMLRGENEYGHAKRLVFSDPESFRLVNTMTFPNPLFELEEAVRNSKSNTDIAYMMQPEASAALRKKFPNVVIFYLEINVVTIKGIIEKVRNIVLDWALELGRAGVMGEGMSFSDSDKRRAESITHNIYAQNVIVAGDQASVSATQTATQAPLDLKQLAALLKELRADIARLPDEDREVAEATVAMAEDELAKDQPREGKVRAALKALAPTMGNLTIGVAGSAAWDAIKKIAGIG